MCFYVLTSVEEIKFSLLPQEKIAGVILSDVVAIVSISNKFQVHWRDR